MLSLDVTDKNGFSKAFAKIGKIDSTIYLAADYKPGNIKSIQEQDVTRTISINLEGAFTLLRYLIPHYKKQGTGQIALCGSVAGYKGIPNGQPYSATKAAIINLAESLRAEMIGENIDVRLINPGFVRTALTDKNQFYMPMIIEPEQAAKEIADGLAGNSFEIHFPKRFTFFMKLLNILPYPLYFRLMYFVKPSVRPMATE